MSKLFTYGCLILAIVLGAIPQAVANSGQKNVTTAVCDLMLAKTGELTSISDLLAKVDMMKQYLTELQQHHEGTGTIPHAFSTPETATRLEAIYGPIITSTTFSKELNADETFRMTSHIMGLLSALPQGGIIPASGGTNGSRDEVGSRGGGVGIFQTISRSMGFKTLSITAAAGFEYKAAPADFLLFSLGGFGSESRLMNQLSKALVVFGGGNQAYNEAVEYLITNPEGTLVIIDDPQVGGTSQTLANTPEFKNLARQDSRIIIAHSGSQAGLLLADRLGIKKRALQIDYLAKTHLNILNPHADLHILVPGSKIIGFSGWSDFSKAGIDKIENASAIRVDMHGALEHIHRVLKKTQQPFLYATAGNDPQFDKAPIQPFETMVHQLDDDPNIRYLALTAAKLDLKELNPKIKALSFISPNWEDRTQQFVARTDAFITGGGNQAVIDQSIQAAALNMHQIHIKGANTLTDLRIARIKNPNLKVLSPKEIMALDDYTILKYLGIPSPF
jgi:hypothetical protein